MEGYINLFLNEHENTNRPHYKLLFKIDGVEHEAALWPNKEGKVGFSGKYKPKQPKEPVSDVTQADADKAWDQAKKMFEPKKETVETGALPLVDDKEPIPF